MLTTVQQDKQYRNDWCVYNSDKGYVCEEKKCLLIQYQVKNTYKIK